MITKSLNGITVQNTASIAETLAVSDDPTFAGNLQGTASQGQQWRMDGTIGPSVTTVIHGRLTLSAGALTVDLRSWTDAVLGSMDLNGLKLKLMKLSAPSTNAGAITIKPGASNGYAGWAGSGGLILAAGDHRGPDIFNSMTGVDSTHKTLDLTGTGTDVIDVIMGFGA